MSYFTRLRKKLGKMLGIHRRTWTKMDVGGNRSLTEVGNTRAKCQIKYKLFASCYILSVNKNRNCYDLKRGKKKKKWHDNKLELETSTFNFIVTIERSTLYESKSEQKENQQRGLPRCSYA